MWLNIVDSNIRNKKKQRQELNLEDSQEQENTESSLHLLN